MGYTPVFSWSILCQWGSKLTDGGKFNKHPQSVKKKFLCYWWHWPSWTSKNASYIIACGLEAFGAVLLVKIENVFSTRFVCCLFKKKKARVYSHQKIQMKNILSCDCTPSEYWGLWPVFSEALNFSVVDNLQRSKTVGRHIIIHKGFGYFPREMDDPLAGSRYLIHHHIPAEE